MNATGCKSLESVDLKLMADVLRMDIIMYPTTSKEFKGSKIRAESAVFAKPLCILRSGKSVEILYTKEQALATCKGMPFANAIF